MITALSGHCVAASSAWITGFPRSGRWRPSAGWAGETGGLDVRVWCRSVRHDAQQQGTIMTGLGRRHHRGTQPRSTFGRTNAETDRRAAATRPRVGFVLEQSLGHATHAANLQRLIGTHHGIDACFRTIAGQPTRIPGLRNWTIQAGLQARRRISEMRRCADLDALFIHTQVPAMLLPDVLRRIPTVVSLDATPLQYDEFGQHYGHASGPAVGERVKHAVHRDCFRRAAQLVTWSEWAKAGLVADYGVPDTKINVIPPGVDTEIWQTLEDRSATVVGPLDVPRLLFVGGDFERKGGLVLLEAARRLRARGVCIELDVVTRDDVPTDEHVCVHHGLAPNSPELVGLYRHADIFCLPTLGDCLGIAFAEAGAMRLPSIATDIGAVGEIVEHERTGLLVPVGDADQLAQSIERLVADVDLRLRLGASARRHVLDKFDGSRNTDQLVDLLAATATDTR
jgi:glycosyltransferase involved in cell wall biosynthesis